MKLACATASGVALLADSQLKYICQAIPEEHRPFTRLNDDACDSQGRFFVGSLYNKDAGIPGMLYRIDPSNGSVVVVDEGPFTVSHSLDEEFIPYPHTGLTPPTGFERTRVEPGRKDIVSVICFAYTQ